MKASILIFCALLLVALTPNVLAQTPSAGGSGGGGGVSLCFLGGFDKTIAAWGFFTVNGSQGFYEFVHLLNASYDSGTVIEGLLTNAYWDVGSSEATGIVYRLNNTNEYVVIHDINGYVGNQTNALVQMNFCSDINEIPEFNIFSLALVSVLSLGILYLIRK